LVAVQVRRSIAPTPINATADPAITGFDIEILPALSFTLRPDGKQPI